jgi:hypothetical protein
LTYSKAAYYDGNLNNDILPEDVGTAERDEIGIIRAICVKVRSTLLLVFRVLTRKDKARSSAQRKEAFKSIQSRRSERPLQLLLDMKVRWSSTYVMLIRTETRRKVLLITLYEVF